MPQGQKATDVCVVERRCLYMHHEVCDPMAVKTLAINGANNLFFLLKYTERKIGVERFFTLKLAAKFEKILTKTVTF